MSHVQVLAEISGALKALQKDPLLSDIGPCMNPEEIDASIALLRGQALKLQLRFFDNQTLRKSTPISGLPSIFFSVGGPAGL